jgi:hypothetical protein
MPEEEDDASHPAEGADTPPQNGCCIGTGVPIWEPSENTAPAGFLYRNHHQTTKSGLRCMVATGAKKADSMFRRKSWQQFEKDYLLYPLKDWGTREVLGYLSIPRPADAQPE